METGQFRVNSQESCYQSNALLNVSKNILFLVFGMHLIFASSSALSAQIWNKHTAPIFGIQDMRDIVYGNGKYIIVGVATPYSDLGIMYSKDLNELKPTTTPALGQQFGVAFCSGIFISVGAGYNMSTTPAPPLVTSTDGVNWVSRTQTINYAPPDKTWAHYGLRDVACSSRVMIAAGEVGEVDGKNHILRSVDGIHWNAIEVPGDYTIFESASYMNGHFYIGSGFYGGSGFHGSSILRSKDGLVWEKVYEDMSGFVTDFTYANNTYFATVEQPAQILSSADGKKWTVVSTPPSALGMLSIDFGDSQFVAIGWNLNGTTPIYRSFNGRTWTKEDSGLRETLYRVRYINGKFVALGTYSYLTSNPLDVPEPVIISPLIHLLLD